MCDEGKKSLWYRMNCKGEEKACVLCGQSVCKYHGASNNGGIKGGHAGCKGSCATALVFKHMCSGQMCICEACGHSYCDYHGKPVLHIGKIKGGHVCSAETAGGAAVNKVHGTVSGERAKPPPRPQPPSVGESGGDGADTAEKGATHSTASGQGDPADDGLPPPAYSSVAPAVAPGAYAAASGGSQPINAPGRWDVFLSHTQRSGQATTLASELFAALTARGFSCWYDVRMDCKSMLAMNEGVLNSILVVAIITGPCINPDRPDDAPESNAYFSRQICVRELQWAREAGVAIQPVIRAEDKKRIMELTESAPGDLKHLIDIDFIDFDRSKAARFDVDVDSLVKEIERHRAAAAAAAPPK